MKVAYIGFFLCLWLVGCSSAQKADDLQVGGAFENRDYIFLGMPGKLLPVDTSVGWSDSNQKMLLTGRILQQDKRTPASGIILYYYHTDSEGLYSPKNPQNDADRRHGHLRGWVKTDRDGVYKIFTSKPASYPNLDAPAHIHLTIKEPGLTAYWIDELVFHGDPFVDDEYEKRMGNRGGRGIIELNDQSDYLLAEHDIILGMNIPGYPQR